MCALQDQRYKAAIFAADAPTFPTEDPRPAARLTTVAALSVVSKYWNRVVEPYRFWVRQIGYSSRVVAQAPSS
jgi:hypothetical protein